MPRYHNINGEHVQFTAEEETARDAEEAQTEIDSVARNEQRVKRETLEAKLADDSITFNQLKELMRLREN